jgi:hypothetical protein
MNISNTTPDLLTLAAEGRERAAKIKLREMTPDEWRDLRQALVYLDGWLDDVIIERHHQQTRVPARAKAEVVS